MSGRRAYLREENIEYIAFRTFIGNYLESQIQDPESVKPSLGGFIDFVRTSKNPFINEFLGKPVRLVDTVVNGAVGLYQSVENAGRALGNYAWTMTTSTNTLVDWIQGDISWDEYNIRIAEDDRIRRSIAIGHLSGFIDAAVGTVAGPLATVEYIQTGGTFWQDGITGLISAKDDAIVDGLGLSREDYMQGKNIATVEAIVATLVYSLGKSMANTAAKTEVIGKPHGSKAHQQYIMDEVSKLEQSGNYSEIYINKSLKTAGLEGTQRPDFTAINNNSKVPNYIGEVASPSQLSGTLRTNLIIKSELMSSINPGSTGNVIFPTYQ